jgi:hypothetical protein
MLDPDQVETMVRDLQRAETRRTTVDPTFGVRLMADRATIERAFREVPGRAPRDAGGLFGVVESDVSALVRLLSDPPVPPEAPPPAT